MIDLPEEVLFNVILPYIPLRDLSLYREVCSLWYSNLSHLITSDTIGEYKRKTNYPTGVQYYKLREACKDINLNGFKEEYIDLFSHEDMKMPFLDVEEKWPEEYEYLLAAEDEIWFIRHTLLDYISDTHIIPLLYEEEYLFWYLKLINDNKSMILRLPPDLRDDILQFTDITQIDILLYERKQERLNHPFDLGDREVVYDFNTLDLKEGDYLVYIGLTTEGFNDRESHLCSSPEWIDSEIYTVDKSYWGYNYDTSILCIYVQRCNSKESMIDVLPCLHYHDVHIGQMKNGRIIDVTGEHWDP